MTSKSAYMKSVKILGTGCPKCKRTAENVETAIMETKLRDIEVEKVENILEIMEYDVLTTPAVVIDDKVIIKGRVPTVMEMKELLINS